MSRSPWSLAPPQSYHDATCSCFENGGRRLSDAIEPCRLAQLSSCTVQPSRAPMSLPEYVSVPSSAAPISSPIGSGPLIGAVVQNVPGPSKMRRAPSFPPSVPPPPPARKFGVPSTSSITTNVSDMLLSSLLPPNLPKLPGGKAGGHGVARELSTRKEALSLPLVSNNFRRFVTKVRMYEP